MPPPTRVGGGIVDLPRADQPLIFVEPTAISFGLLGAGGNTSAPLQVTDAGGGAGTWTVTVEQIGPAAGVTVSTAPAVEAPGSLLVAAQTTPGAPERDVTGYVILSKDGQKRRIPFWLRVTRPLLGTEPFVRLTHQGTYRADTRGGVSRVVTYRYPEVPGSRDLPAALRGPERVFRITVPSGAANFGVAVVSRTSGVTVQPRVVAGADENRLTGYAGLPVVLNPYLADYDDPVPSAGALLPAAGPYAIVFDSTSASGAGSFSFRYWLNDVTPPTARPRTLRVGRGVPLVVSVADGQSGVDPDTIVATIDGVSRAVTYARGQARIDIGGLARGRHRLRFQVSDYQETRNMENIAAILPNTRRLVATLVVG